MGQEDLKEKIAELEREIEMMKNNGDDEMVELMQLELEEMKARLKG